MAGQESNPFGLTLLSDKLNAHKGTDSEGLNVPLTLKPIELDVRAVQYARPTILDRGLELKSTYTKNESSYNPVEDFLQKRIELKPELSIENLKKTEERKRRFENSWKAAKKGETDYKFDSYSSAKIRSAKKSVSEESGKNTLALAIAMQESNLLTADYPFGDITPPKYSLREVQVSGYKDTPSVGGDFYQNKNLKVDYPLIGTIEDFRSQPKVGDGANFGLYKMNWFMIKQCQTGIQLIQEAQTKAGIATDIQPDANIENAVGAKINADPKLATKILGEAMKKWHAERAPDPDHPVEGNFWAGHRWGESGLNNVPNADWYDILKYYRAVQNIQSRIINNDKSWENEIRYWVDVPYI